MALRTARPPLLPYTDALPICSFEYLGTAKPGWLQNSGTRPLLRVALNSSIFAVWQDRKRFRSIYRGPTLDRKSTRLNSSHGYISYAVVCLKREKVRHSVGRPV